MLRITYVGRLFENTLKVERHSHKSWELVYYTSGSGYVEIGDEVIPFEEGDIFIIPPNIQHTDYAEKGFMNYHFNLCEFDFKIDNYLKFNDDKSRDFLKILTQLYYEYHLKRKNWKNIVNSLSDTLIQYTLAFSERLNENEYVDKVINEIIFNFSDCNFDLNEAIEDTHLNKDYFRRLFTLETGKSPLQFLTTKRIAYAKQLLISQKKTNMQLNEIAWRSGFKDYYYFSRVFKKETGQSPKNWTDKIPEANEPLPTRYTDRI